MCNSLTHKDSSEIEIELQPRLFNYYYRSSNNYCLILKNIFVCPAHPPNTLSRFMMNI